MVKIILNKDRKTAAATATITIMATRRGVKGLTENGHLSKYFFRLPFPGEGRGKRVSKEKRTKGRMKKGKAASGVPDLFKLGHSWPLSLYFRLFNRVDSKCSI